MKVLIADDNRDFSTTLEEIVQSFGYETHSIQDPQEVLSYLARNNRNIGLLLLDIEFGPDASLNGIDIIESCRKNYQQIPVVMISGKGTIEMAVRATKLGAVNFIEKSILNKDILKQVFDSAIDRFAHAAEAQEIQKFLAANGIIGKSKAMLEVGDSINRFGRTDLNVLITGETGTGKKLVAKAIHSVSRRAKFPFVTVDIPNIPKELFQSELFGHNKGSFSGAIDTKKGLFHQANKGTLFLDEIGDLSPDLQANLFIPIEEKLVRRVGSIQSEDLDIRFVSATDKDLLYAMKESRFREQLYHRLRECEIHIPPLLDRPEDIPPLVDLYLQKHNLEFNESKCFSPASIEYIQEQNWPGNVRELGSVLRVTLQTVKTDEVDIADLHRIITNTVQSHKHILTSDSIISSDKTLKEDLAEVDKKKIEATLKRCKGNVTSSAAQLGISRETLHNKIRRYGINTQMYREKKHTAE